MTGMAKAYVIVDVTVTDPEVYEGYRALSTSSVAQYGGRWVVRGGDVEVLEGSWDPGRVVVIEFDDVAAARRWYDSPEYAEAREIRQRASTGSLLVVSGV